MRNYLSNPVTIQSEKDLLNDALSRRGNGELRFTEIIINKGDLYIDPEKEINIAITAKVNKEVKSAYFLMTVKGPENSEPITNTGLLCITEDYLQSGMVIKFNLVIPAGVFRTGLFPVYFWLGQKAEDAVNNYLFDVIDSVYYFNITSDKPKEILGYNSMQPVGYFNFDKKITNIQIQRNVEQ